MSRSCWFLIAAFALVTVPRTFSAETNVPSKAILAVVNGQKITWTHLQPVLDRMKINDPKIKPETRKMMQRQALAMTIDEMLLEQFIRRQVPAITKAAVDQELAKLQAGLKKHSKSLNDYLKDSGQSLTTLRANVANVLRWQAYAKKYVTDAELKKYYVRYKDFFDKVVVRASHIVVQVPPGAKETSKKAIEEKLGKIRKLILAGKVTFADAAKKYSTCPSAAKGGDLGTFPRKYAVDDEFARVAFSMKPNQLSGIVKTDFGYHLILVTDRKPGTPWDFN